MECNEPPPSGTKVGERENDEKSCWERKSKPQDLLLIQKFVGSMKDSKRKIVNGQIFEKAANPWAM